MQFSLFGAAVAEPTRADLDGLLLAGGHWVRATTDGTERARLSVLVDELWRANALETEFEIRSLPAEHLGADGGSSDGGLRAVRTGFRTDLVASAARWTRGARTAPPTDLALSAGGLRLWAIASGHRDDAGYLLGTGPTDNPVYRSAGSQLARHGLAAVGVGERGRPGWRITGIKRLRRFAELIGEPPPDSAPHWPV